MSEKKAKKLRKELRGEAKGAYANLANREMKKHQSFKKLFLFLLGLDVLLVISNIALFIAFRAMSAQ